MAFLGGLKQSLKLDEMAGGVASKLNSAKEYIHEKQQSVSDSGPMRMVKEKAALVGQYVPSTGPIGNYFNASSWSKYFPAGGGKLQSPIDILTSEAKFDESLVESQMQVQYDPRDPVEMVNTGFVWQINCRPETTSTLTASYLPGDYKLHQVHCHWGTEPMNGSEHLVGGVGYAGEMHLIHYNTKYGSFDESLKHADGLAALAVFLNESHDNNANFDTIVRLMQNVVYKGDRAPLDSGLDLKKLLPENRSEFWTYEGSLTSPPCSEAVIWTVFRACIPISSSQLDSFRQMFAVEVEDCERNPLHLVGNVRPTQPLNGRLVRSSFRSGGVVEQQS